MSFDEVVSRRSKSRRTPPRGFGLEQRCELCYRPHFNLGRPETYF